MPKAENQQSRMRAPLDAKALLAWYDGAARVLPWRVAPEDKKLGEVPDPYRVWLSEVMLQQTTVAAVIGYFNRFIARWPDVEALAAAPLDDVLVEWAGLGYYARARNLHACATKVVSDFDGVFPDNAEGLLALPGIGPYTAAAIAAICYDEQVAVVDGNVDRVMARFLALEVPVRAAKPEIKAEVQRAVPKRAGDFAQAMMDLGATLCAPRAASCMLCPVRAGCAAAKIGAPEQYPIRPIKPERPVRHGHAFIIQNKDGDVWLRQRPGKGLLAKMTEVPGSDWGAKTRTPDFPLQGEWHAAGHVSHVFTHFRLELMVWRCVSNLDAPDETGWWAHDEGLDDEALPSLFRKVLAVAGLGGAKLSDTGNLDK